MNRGSGDSTLAHAAVVSVEAERASEFSEIFEV